MDPTNYDSITGPAVCNIDSDGIISVKIKRTDDIACVPSKRFKSVNKVFFEQTIKKEECFNLGQEENKTPVKNFEHRSEDKFLKTDEPSLKAEYRQSCSSKGSIESVQNLHDTHLNQTTENNWIIFDTNLKPYVKQENKLVVSKSIFNFNVDSTTCEIDRQKNERIKEGDRNDSLVKPSVEGKGNYKCNTGYAHDTKSAAYDNTEYVESTTSKYETTQLADATSVQERVQSRPHKKENCVTFIEQLSETKSNLFDEHRTIDEHRTTKNDNSYISEHFIKKEYGVDESPELMSQNTDQMSQNTEQISEKTQLLSGHVGTSYSVSMEELDSTIEQFVQRAMDWKIVVTNTNEQNTSSLVVPRQTIDYTKPSHTILRASDSKKNNMIQCVICSKVMADQNSYQQHLNSHVKNHKCDLCGAEFKQKRSLNKHKETSHSEHLPFKCGVCGLHFVCSSSHGKHLKKHSLNNFLQSCKDMSSRSVASLDKDQFKILDLNSLFKPNEKQEISNTEESLSDCFLKGKSLNREKVLKYECPVCGKKFAEKVNLRAHKAIHGEKRYSCDICGKMFNKINNLQKHRIIHTGEKPYTCPVCGRDFADPSSARRHQRTHTGLKPHKCELCGKHFSETSLLNRHKKRHMNFRPFQCHLCDKSFGDSDHLNRHVRTHTGEKPYSCEICGQRFTQSSSLNVHMRRHTGVRPFQCGICLQEFTRALHLRKHLARLHGEDRPHKCDICGKQYQSFEELENHLKTHFSDDDMDNLNLNQQDTDLVSKNYVFTFTDKNVDGLDNADVCTDNTVDGLENVDVCTNNTVDELENVNVSGDKNVDGLEKVDDLNKEVDV